MSDQEAAKSYREWRTALAAQGLSPDAIEALVWFDRFLSAQIIAMVFEEVGKNSYGAAVMPEDEAQAILANDLDGIHKKTKDRLGEQGPKG